MHFVSFLSQRGKGQLYGRQKQPGQGGDPARPLEKAGAECPSWELPGGGGGCRGQPGLGWKRTATISLKAPHVFAQVNLAESEVTRMASDYSETELELFKKTVSGCFEARHRAVGEGGVTAHPRLKCPPGSLASHAAGACSGHVVFLREDSPPCLSAHRYLEPQHNSAYGKWWAHPIIAADSVWGLEGTHCLASASICLICKMGIAEQQTVGRSAGERLPVCHGVFPGVSPPVSWRRWT